MKFQVWSFLIAEVGFGIHTYKFGSPLSIGPHLTFLASLSIRSLDAQPSQGGYVWSTLCTIVFVLHAFQAPLQSGPEVPPHARCTSHSLERVLNQRAALAVMEKSFTNICTLFCAMQIGIPFIVPSRCFDSGLQLSPQMVEHLPADVSPRLSSQCNDGSWTFIVSMLCATIH